MSLLSRLARSRSPAPQVPELSLECRHMELAPRWDSVADIGKKDRIVTLTCTACKEVFSPAEAERFAAV